MRRSANLGPLVLLSTAEDDEEAALGGFSFLELFFLFPVTGEQSRSDIPREVDAPDASPPVDDLDFFEGDRMAAVPHKMHFCLFRGP